MYLKFTRCERSNKEMTLCAIPNSAARPITFLTSIKTISGLILFNAQSSIHTWLHSSNAFLLLCSSPCAR
ncbi:hypothetical protein QW060_08225 [Myroides ceti]|uniref:Uncharacterized protein n=1 Tax=Paenimyroides ceti TaxID=395087 RepID=A0ABT8CRV7_9FLAO|nr:hypothetical protein [Paenimyroides ceti]MDN3707120.1 hypothetical protein [Paenimyroides ceti]